APSRQPRPVAGGAGLRRGRDPNRSGPGLGPAVAPGVGGGLPALRRSARVPGANGELERRRGGAPRAGGALHPAPRPTPGGVPRSAAAHLALLLQAPDLHLHGASAHSPGGFVLRARGLDGRAPAPRSEGLGRGGSELRAAAPLPAVAIPAA